MCFLFSLTRFLDPSANACQQSHASFLFSLTRFTLYGIYAESLTSTLSILINEIQGWIITHVWEPFKETFYSH